MYIVEPKDIESFKKQSTSTEDLVLEWQTLCVVNNRQKNSRKAIPDNRTMFGAAVTCLALSHGTCLLYFCFIFIFVVLHFHASQNNNVYIELNFYI